MYDSRTSLQLAQVFFSGNFPNRRAWRTAFPRHRQLLHVHPPKSKADSWGHANDCWHDHELMKSMRIFLGKGSFIPANDKIHRLSHQFPREMYNKHLCPCTQPLDLSCWEQLHAFARWCSYTKAKLGRSRLLAPDFWTRFNMMFIGFHPWKYDVCNDIQASFCRDWLLISSFGLKWVMNCSKYI